MVTRPQSGFNLSGLQSHPFMQGTVSPEVLILSRDRKSRKSKKKNTTDRMIAKASKSELSKGNLGMDLERWIEFWQMEITR